MCTASGPRVKTLGTILGCTPGAIRISGIRFISSSNMIRSSIRARLGNAVGTHCHGGSVLGEVLVPAARHVVAIRLLELRRIPIRR